MILESVRLRRLTRKPEHAMRRTPVDVVESGFVWADTTGRASTQHGRHPPYFLTGPRHVRFHRPNLVRLGKCDCHEPSIVIPCYALRRETGRIWCPDSRIQWFNIWGRILSDNL
ncbi:hypothetical protein D3C86_1210590 [compost metagenome]